MGGTSEEGGGATRLPGVLSGPPQTAGEKEERAASPSGGSNRPGTLHFSRATPLGPVPGRRGRERARRSGARGFRRTLSGRSCALFPAPRTRAGSARANRTGREVRTGPALLSESGLRGEETEEAWRREPGPV